MRAFVLLAAVLASFAALAQEWPAKPVRMIVPFPPGGATGTIGAEMVYRAEPDGYTLLATPPSPLVINPSLYAKLPYDASQFVPISVIGSIPSVMLVHPKVPAKSVREFVEYARANPGRLNYASQALAAAMAGETEIFFDNLGASLAQVRAGRLKALAVCGERRHPSLPDVPAMAEIYPGFVSIAWFGILAPPRTPAAIAEKLADLSAEPIGMGPAEMAKFMQGEATRWREAIRFAGLKRG